MLKRAASVFLFLKRFLFMVFVTLTFLWIVLSSGISIIVLLYLGDSLYVDP